MAKEPQACRRGAAEAVSDATDQRERRALINLAAGLDVASNSIAYAIAQQTGDITQRT